MLNHQKTEDEQGPSERDGTFHSNIKIRVCLFGTRDCSGPSILISKQDFVCSGHATVLNMIEHRVSTTRMENVNLARVKQLSSIVDWVLPSPSSRDLIEAATRASGPPSQAEEQESPNPLMAADQPQYLKGRRQTCERTPMGNV